MNPTRTGKIARLPKSIRDELNQRLVDGEPASEILPWLNHHPDVETVLFKYFNCRPINQQNLTDWRQGGHQDWLEEQQTLAFASQLVERSQNLAEQSGSQRLPDHFATLLATEFIKLAQVMLDEHQNTKQRWDCLCGIQDRLSRLRRDDHRAVHASIHQERWTRQIKAEDTAAAKAAEAEERRQWVVRYRILCGGILNSEAQMYGQSDIARDVAAMSLEEQHHLKFGLLGRKSDLFAARTDSEEHIFPWRRPMKNRTTSADAEPTPTTAEATPAPSPDPRALETTSAHATSSDLSNLPDSSDTSTPATNPTPSTTERPPTDDAIPLANDNPPSDLPPNTPCRVTRRSPASPETLHRPTPNFENLKPLPETFDPSHQGLGNDGN